MVIARMMFILTALCATADVTHREDARAAVKYNFRVRDYVVLDYGMGTNMNTFRMDSTVIERYKDLSGYHMARVSWDAYEKIMEDGVGHWEEFLNNGVIESESKSGREGIEGSEGREGVKGVKG
ncbi:hypothetical protein VCUG_01186 [Vavraia culicis subsp. floridensis]|uniref:Uncharacterized protein n=1 Tax=Vavraia culicis (isolate floridensis) TaxID=948595 RepID=L2GVB8_VAVCU|nr:uncharacterized protein VCUG_01186 [Vavraia culicis subsp. floridensis]ELA47302.1 hypothetical protein VCUG_01186 [Vavraia culicis subsp. floridensis]